MITASTDASLFDTYPVQEHYELSSGTVCQVPYYCRNANMLLLHGLADLGAVRRLLQGQSYHPVATSQEKAIASLWFVEYRDTSCGPYHEVILSFASSRKPLSLGYGGPMDLLGALVHPEVTTFSYELYLDQHVPIEYGRELHGIPKHRQPEVIDISMSGPRARFTLVQGGTVAVEGDIQLPQEPGALVRSSVSFVTPVELLQTRNVLHMESAPRFRAVDGQDSLTFSEEAEFGRKLRELGFEARLTHYVPEARFVMPKPLNWRGIQEGAAT